MKKNGLLIIGVALLCALPILGTLLDVSNGLDRTVRLAAPVASPVTLRSH